MKTAFAILLGILLTVSQTFSAAFASSSAQAGCCEKSCACPPVDCCAPQPAPGPVRAPAAPAQTQQTAKQQQLPPAVSTVAFHLPPTAGQGDAPAVLPECLPVPVPLYQRNCVLLI